MYYPIVQVRKVKFRGIKRLHPSHRANEWQRPAPHSGKFNSEALCPGSLEPVKSTTLKARHPRHYILVPKFVAFADVHRYRSHAWAHPIFSLKTKRKKHFQVQAACPGTGKCVRRKGSLSLVLHRGRNLIFS